MFIQNKRASLHTRQTFVICVTSKSKVEKHKHYILKYLIIYPKSCWCRNTQQQISYRMFSLNCEALLATRLNTGFVPPGELHHSERADVSRTSNLLHNSPERSQSGLVTSTHCEKEEAVLAASELRVASLFTPI